MELSTFFSVLAIVIVPIVTYLLNKKDAAQEQQLAALKDLNEKLQKQIDLLFKKHDEDAANLASLQLQIAKEHYLKHELDARFQSLEHTFRQGFGDLSAEFKELSRILLEHVSQARRPE